MGDRTAFQMTIYASPEPDETEAILTVIDEYSLSVNWGNRERAEGLLLGEQYTYEEMSVGTVSELGRQLIELAPHASWEMWEDPKYEWLGDLWRYTPEDGSFRAECNSEGSVLLDPEIVRNLLDGSADLNEARERFDALSGRPWTKRFAQLREDSQDYAPCCPDPGCGGNPCTFPGYADSH